MSARDLMVRPGDRVAVSGRYVAREDGDWLDVALVDDLLFHPPDWKSDHSFRLFGLDPSGVPTDWGPDNAVVPGRVRVVGVWDGDAITVEEQGPVRRTHEASPTFRPPCPAPDGGWDTTTDHQDVPELESLRASGAIAADWWVWVEDGGAVVLIVAATDVERVRAVLGPRLPRRLCVVASRYSAEHVREVQDMLLSHFQEWDLQISSAADLNEGQPHAYAHLLRVTDDIAAWADTLPDGLLDLRPIMIPA